jgi:Protein of unknown function (DUF3987)
MTSPDPDYTVERIEPNGKTIPPLGSNGSAAPGSTTAYVPEKWPKLDNGTLHGLGGEVVTCLIPHTESDPAALLLQFLASFGNAVGRGPYYQVEDDQHFANLFVLLAGDTAKARKGTSAGRVRAIFKLADQTWANECQRGGMSSGEGVISAVRDARFVNRKGVPELVDEGVTDKRLLFYEPEFASVLTVLSREGNTLSAIIRDAWDCRQVLQTSTKHSPDKATEAFVSIVGHITIVELQRRLDETAMANGFANRFLLGCVQRAQLLAHGGNFPDHSRDLLGKRVTEALNAARTFTRLRMTAEAHERWSAEYPALTKSGNTLTDQMTARGEAQVIRLALIYALLDKTPAIAVEHLEPALALWRFCHTSARYIFGEMTGDAAGDVILRALRTAGSEGMAKRDIFNLFGRNLAAAKIDGALGRLQAAGKATSREVPPARGSLGGRPKQMWYAVERAK